MTKTPNKLTAVELQLLIKKAKDGNQEALAKLLGLYRSYLRLLAQLRFDARLVSKTSPSDIVQETMLRATQKFPDFRGGSEGELIWWFRKILVSQIVAQVRYFNAQRRDVKIERSVEQSMDNSSSAGVSFLTARGRSPSESACRRERAVILADALEAIRPEYREILVLKHLKGKTFHEIAEQTGHTLDTVKGRWRRGIARLRVVIGENRV